MSLAGFRRDVRRLRGLAEALGELSSGARSDSAIDLVEVSPGVWARKNPSPIQRRVSREVEHARAIGADLNALGELWRKL